MIQGLNRFNELPSEEAEAQLLKCCGSRSWARQMTRWRPFETIDGLLKKADDVWWSLNAEDWLEAFCVHPRIGEKKAVATQSAEAQKWSTQEQSGIEGAPAETTSALAAGNREYERRFGFIYIVCATGKTSEEMLAILRERLQNDPETELRVAAEEQRKITRLRLERLLTG